MLFAEGSTGLSFEGGAAATSTLITFLLGIGIVFVGLIMLIVMWALLVPATVTFMYVFFIYDGMSNMIDSKNEANKKKDSPDEKTAPEPVHDDYADIDISSLRDTDEYIFHNGRMVKQSTLLHILREREKSEKGDSNE